MRLGQRFKGGLTKILERGIFLLVLTMCLRNTASAAASEQVVAAFSGSIIDCICRLPEGYQQTMTVSLPTVSAKTFSEIGARAGHKKFSLRLVECPPNRKIYVRFDGRWAMWPPQLVALNGGSKLAEGAQGLALGLQQADGSSLRLGDNSLIVTTTPDGTAVFELEAFYQRIASPVVAGIANATINFTVFYN